MAYLSSNLYYNNVNPMIHQPQDQQQHQQQQHQLNHLLSMNNDPGMMSGMGGQDDTAMLDGDSKHELMLPLDFLPCPNTVIVGRGKKVALHPGNVRFREYVKIELEEYSTATNKAHKSSIIVRVLTQVRDKSRCAFVKQDLTTGRWYRVEETSQRITTAQAFRDALKDNYKSSRAHKKLKREEEKEAKTSGDTSDGDDGEEKEAKKKKAAPKPNKKKAAPKKKDADTMKSAAMPAAGVSESPAQKKVMSDLRSMLEQTQDALMSGQARLWNADAPITLAPAAAASLARKPAAKQQHKQSNIPKHSNRSARSNTRNLMNRSMNWSFNSGMSNLSNHSTVSINNRSFNRSFNANNLNMSNHSNISMSRHSNFSGISNFSGHSTGTFTGLMSKFAPTPGAEVIGNPFEPTPMMRADAMDVEMDDVATSLATARPTFAPRSILNRDAHTSAAGIVAAANHPHLHQGSHHGSMPLGNLSDHSLMSDFSSIHSRGMPGGFSAEEIFEEMDRSRRLRAMMY